MIRKINEYIGLKFFVLLAGIVVLSVAPLAYVAIQAIKGYGNDIAEVNELQIRSQSFSFLSEIADERAARYQAFFDRVAASAGLMASHASTLYSRLDIYGLSPLVNYEFNYQPWNGQWANSIEDPVISLYWGGRELNPQVEQELRALTHMTPLLQRVLQENEEVLASHMITVSGIGQYFTDDPKSKQIVFNLPPVTEFDLRDGEPMTIFTQGGEKVREVRWTNIYKDDASDGLMLTASAPFYDDRDMFRGIAGIDVPLATVIDDILQSGEGESQDTILFSFLLDDQGRLLALPDAYFPHLGLAIDQSKLQNSGDSLKIGLAQSSNPEVQSLAKAMADENNLFTQFHHEEEPYYVVTSRMAGLGWVFGVVVREADMMASVYQTRTALAQTVRDMEIKGLFLSLFITCLAVGVMFLAVRYLVTPLRALSLATQRVAGGDLQVRCPVTTKDETGVLADSFNTMVAQLQIAQDRQDQYAEELEQTVVERTYALIDKQGELERTVDLLQKEMEQRQLISETLRESQQQYYDTMDASRAGIFIISDNLFTYTNSSLADLFRMERAEMIGTNPLNLVSDEDRPVVQDNMRRRFSGEEIAPYRIRCIRPDGSDFYAEVWAKIAVWQQRPVMVGTISDVSGQKLTEEKVQLQDKQLQRSLEEKEVLLKEVHHRTKNNMMVVISMLDLQMEELKDQRVRTIFLEMEDRIRAMALVHEKLYQSQDLLEIEAESYIREIAESLIANMVLGDRVSLDLDVQALSINIDYAVPLGLVINEIVTNSVKHAFPGRKKGTITIVLRKNPPKEIELFIGDDGVGLPERYDVLNSKSFGIQIITSLVRMQLSGTIKLGREKGTGYSIKFPEPRSVTRL
jgi:PAS domain S-box-containing protein